MSMQKSMTSDTLPSAGEGTGLSPGTMQDTDTTAASTAAAMAGDALGILTRHRGKLAVGAAAMLGLAAFYHWRESKLAKDDEEEFQRLQRLKAALDADKD